MLIGCCSDKNLEHCSVLNSSIRIKTLGYDNPNIHTCGSGMVRFRENKDTAWLSVFKLDTRFSGQP